MNKIKLLTLAVSAVLTACATTTPKVVKTPKTVSTNADMPVLPTPLDPKNVLAMALQTQVRSAFSYQTDVYVFNNKADSKDKKFIEDDTNNKAYDNCETIHDTAYIKLAKEAKQQNKDIKFEEYHDKTDALLQDYKACRDKENTYQTFDFKDFYEKNIENKVTDKNEILKKCQEFIDENKEYFSIESEAEYRKRIEEDFLENKKIIEKKLGNEVKFFCWPWGHRSKETIKVLKELGVVGFISTKKGTNSMKANWDMIRRIELRNYSVKKFKINLLLARNLILGKIYGWIS